MNSFYGNLKNNSRASFIFDKVYPNRVAMENASKSDGVFVNRYVLISYNYYQNSANDPNPYAVEHRNRFYSYIADINDQSRNKREDVYFTQNYQTDINKYFAQYDKTVWMKIYSNNEEKYIQVGSLNAAAPAFELRIDAPGEEDGRPHFDYYHSGDLNYLYHVPKNWDIIINHYNGPATFLKVIKFTDQNEETDAYIIYPKNSYAANTFYYKLNDQYILDTEETPTEDREYYELNPRFLKVSKTDIQTSYEPNKYYYYNNEENNTYLKNEDSTYDVNKEYYERQDTYKNIYVWKPKSYCIVTGDALVPYAFADTYNSEEQYYLPKVENVVINETTFNNNINKYFTIDSNTGNFIFTDQYNDNYTYYQLDFDESFDLVPSFTDINNINWETIYYYISSRDIYNKVNIEKDNEENIIINTIPANGCLFELLKTEYVLIQQPLQQNLTKYYYREYSNYKIDQNNYYTEERQYYLPNTIQDWYYYNDLLASENSLNQYPYVNSRGFSSNTRNYDYMRSDDIHFTEVPSGQYYPNHDFVKIHLTTNTYIPYQFYIKDENNQYILDTRPVFTANTEYYTKAQGHFEPVVFDENLMYEQDKFFIKNEETNQFILSAEPEMTPGVTYYQYSNDDDISIQNDTKRLDIELPSIGNAISDVYDSIYGRPLNPDYPNGIKYTSDPPKYKSSNQLFQTTYDNNHQLQCSIDGQYYYLNNTEWNDELSNVYSDQYPIPVYNLANDKDRPYTQQQLYNFLNIEPYNNVTPNDPVSVAWGVEELKKYISELRYLSHGELDGDFDSVQYNGNGLQSDWSINDPTAFGYIYNKPIIISHYKKVTGNTSFENNDYANEVAQKYYYLRDIDDDQHVPYFFEGKVTQQNNQAQFVYNTKSVTTDPETEEEVVKIDTANIILSYKNPEERTFDSLEQDLYEVADVNTYYRFNDIILEAKKKGHNFITTTNNNEVITYTEIIFNDNITYEANTYYYLDENNDYVLDTANTATNGRVYYTTTSFKVNYFDQNSNNKDIFLGFSGKILSKLTLKNNNIFSLNNFTVDMLNEMNSPGWYEENVKQISFAHDNQRQAIMDIELVRDGKFHLYQNINKVQSGLTIEKIWQNIPVDDIIATETYYDINDVNDIQGENPVEISESVDVLSSPIATITNNISGLSKEIYDIKQYLGSSDTVSTTNVSGRLNTLEGINAKNRLNALENVNARDRLDTLEIIVGSSTTNNQIINIDNRINDLETFVGSSDTATTANISGRLNTLETIVGSSTANNEIINIDNRIDNLEMFVGSSNTATTTNVSGRLNNLETIVDNQAMDNQIINNQIFNIDNRIDNLEMFVGNIPIEEDTSSINAKVIELQSFVGSTSTTDNLSTLSGRVTQLETQIPVEENNP